MNGDFTTKATTAALMYRLSSNRTRSPPPPNTSSDQTTRPAHLGSISIFARELLTGSSQMWLVRKVPVWKVKLRTGIPTVGIIQFEGSDDTELKPQSVSATSKANKAAKLAAKSGGRNRSCHQNKTTRLSLSSNPGCGILRISYNAIIPRRIEYGVDEFRRSTGSESTTSITDQFASE